MLKTLPPFFRSLSLALVLMMGSAIVPQPSYAQAITIPWSSSASGTACASQETLVSEGTGADTAEVATIQGIQCIIANVFSIAISGLGLIGFVMFIVGAFKYLLSGGNAKGIESARNTFTYAIIGLVVALSSVIILNIIAAFTGVNTILNFVIPTSDCGLTQEC